VVYPNPCRLWRAQESPSRRYVELHALHSPAADRQVLIAWSLHKGYVCLPKSSNAVRIAENKDVFGWTLAADVITALDALDADRHCTWDPTREPWSG
jgi:diketogulonate reductase-like aldo/keto reductase